MQRWKVAGFLLGLPISLCQAPVMAASVTEARLSVSPSAYRGDCPAVIKFNGAIRMNSPGTVKYRFIRSDGAIAPEQEVYFRRAGVKTVETTWTLGGTSLPYTKQWEAIRVLSPNRLSSNRAGFSVMCDPPLNSAEAAHGNTDWHIDTANEFLFGTDMAGNATAPNHAPDSWTRRHVHVGLNNTSKYYYDKVHTATGEDTDPAAGIDKPMLFFYAGHGLPNLWDTLGDHASQPNMALANVTQGGTLRYFWQCSCDTFAHGPRTCQGGTMEYACPQDFDGSHDSADMRNVFERWGPVLGADLRMACGVSSLAYCHESNVNKIWDNYNNRGNSVAVSFVDGLGDWGVVPLCITKGGPNISTTPLFDAKFTNKPNASGTTHYHLLYAAGTQTTPSSAEIAIPSTLPKLQLTPAELPPKIRSLGLESGGTGELSSAAFAGGRATVRVEPASGAVYLVSVQPEAERQPSLDERGFAEQAGRIVRELGWDTGDVGEPTVSRIMSASMPIGGRTGGIEQRQQGARVTFHRKIDVGGRPIPVIGEGGTITVDLTSGGNAINASRVWRQAQPTSAAELQVKSFEDAQREALQKLDKPDAYSLHEWRWGYKELAGGVSQQEMDVAYQFAFVPKPGEDLLKYPPRIVEIPGFAQQ